MLIAFKIILVVGLLLVFRVYITALRTIRRDRLILLGLFAALVGAVIYPEATTWVANRVGIGRGVDLAFYLAFLVVFFLGGMLYSRVTELRQSLTTVVRELALLRAKEPQDRET